MPQRARQLRTRQPGARHASGQAVERLRAEHAAAQQALVALQAEVALLHEAERRREAAYVQASHDLRAPLASIATCSQALLQGVAGPLGPDQQEVLEGVAASAHGLLDLVAQVLARGRTSSAQTPVRPQPTALGFVVREVAEQLGPLATSHGGCLQVDLVPLDSLPPLLAAPRRLHQVVLNLVANAVKHAPGATITIRAVAEDRHVRFEVADDGPGLPPGWLLRPWHPGGAGPSASGLPGTGRGLALVKEIADAHAVFLDVRTVPGLGTCFSLRWPIAHP